MQFFFIYNKHGLQNYFCNFFSYQGTSGVFPANYQKLLLGPYHLHANSLSKKNHSYHLTGLVQFRMGPEWGLSLGFVV